MAKMSVDNNQDDKQLVTLCKRLLRNFAGQELDGIQASMKIQEFYGLHIDHHILTDVMDSMTRTDEAICTQGWGYTKYVINS